MLEARDRVGGRVWSRELDNGAIVEMGAEFLLPGNTAVRELAERATGSASGTRACATGSASRAARTPTPTQLVAAADAVERRCERAART